MLSYFSISVGLHDPHVCVDCSWCFHLLLFYYLFSSAGIPAGLLPLSMVHMMATILLWDLASIPSPNPLLPIPQEVAVAAGSEASPQPLP